MTFQVKDSITVNETLAINSSGQVVTPLAVSSTSTSSITNTNGAGGTTFNVTQSGTYSNVANIQATASGGSFNIIQHSH